jgi:DNA replication and repair protein RecF
VRRLEVSNVRSWERLALALDLGLIVVSGPNGAGKTSLVEAITFATIGVSPRTAREAEAVRRGAEALHVAAEIDGPCGTHRREIGFQSGVGRRLRRDGTAVRSLADWRVPGAVLVFLPEELRSVKGPPAARRRALDRLLEGSYASYTEASSAYLAAVSQRNALLRRIRAGLTGETGLDPWDRTCVELGARVAAARAAAIADLSGPFGEWLACLGGGSGGHLALEPSPSALAGVAPGDLASVLADTLARTRSRDIQAAQTVSGPHRDDVWIGIGDHDLRRLGSQGEQRTAVLAFLLACRDHLAIRAAAPIMLLDDVLSELDPGRRRLLLDALTGVGQAWVTSADPDAAALAEAAGAAHHVHVEDGHVR